MTEPSCSHLLGATIGLTPGLSGASPVSWPSTVPLHVAWLAGDTFDHGCFEVHRAALDDSADG